MQLVRGAAANRQGLRLLSRQLSAWLRKQSLGVIKAEGSSRDISVADDPHLSLSLSKSSSHNSDSNHRYQKHQERHKEVLGLVDGHIRLRLAHMQAPVYRRVIASTSKKLGYGYGRATSLGLRESLHSTCLIGCRHWTLPFASHGLDGKQLLRHSNLVNFSTSATQFRQQQLQLSSKATTSTITQKPSPKDTTSRLITRARHLSTISTQYLSAMKMSYSQSHEPTKTATGAQQQQKHPSTNGVHNKSTSTMNHSFIESEPSSIFDNKQVHKQVTFNACGELYETLAKTNPSLYAYAPKGKGIDFTLQYLDSGEVISASCGLPADKLPVVCILHGAPGHYSEFKELINFLGQHNVRCVAPNFPDFSATIEHSFRHSPVERVDMLMSFFKTLNISELAMMVGHSSAVYTIFEMLHQMHESKNRKLDGFTIKSVGLLSAPSHKLAPHARPTPFRTFVLGSFDYSLIRSFMGPVLAYLVKLQGIPNRVESSRPDDFLLSASAIGYGEVHKMVEYSKMVRKHNLLVFKAFGCRDKLMPKSTFEQFKLDIGVAHKDEQTKIYDHKGDLVKDSSLKDDIVAVSQFETGGHYTFQKYFKQVNQDLWQFLVTRRVINE